MISIYTHTSNPLKKEFWKWIARKILKKYSGPDAVLDSLKRGLTELQVPFKINPLFTKKDSVVHVLSSIKVLEQMIQKKKKGDIKKLIAGPNLVIHPHDNNKILNSEEIDTILVVSQWTYEFYSKHLSEIKEKLSIWPAGVKIPPESSKTKKEYCIIYKKNVSDDIFNTAVLNLKKNNIDYVLLNYSNFNQKKYFDLLNEASFMIYLQEVESQGIALQEAWIRNVPTLVWNKESFVYPNGEKVFGNIAAPFLTEECGLFFKDKGDFEEKLDLFLKNIDKFQPRRYCMENLSDKKSAEIYVKILNQ